MRSEKALAGILYKLYGRNAVAGSQGLKETL